MKNSIILICCLFFLQSLYAQQEPQFTQFMYNKLYYNPAYAGSHEATCLTALYRNQWLGLNGAPTSLLAAVNIPLQNQRVGLGATIYRNTIGISDNFGVDASYAYRVKLGSGFLGLGVMASVRAMTANFNETDPIQSNDLSIPNGLQSKYIPNFGFGAYYHSNKFFAGLSAPRLLENNIDFADEEIVLSREVRHLFFMAGFLVNINKNVKLQPQAILKYVEGAPFDADINLNFIIVDRYTIGASYRVGGSSVNSKGESIDIILGAQVTNNLLFSLGYDITLTELRNYNDGTVEAVVRYCFGKSESEEYLNPRFF